MHHQAMRPKVHSVNKVLDSVQVESCRRLISLYVNPRLVKFTTKKVDKPHQFCALDIEQKGAGQPTFKAMSKMGITVQRSVSNVRITTPTCWCVSPELLAVIGGAWLSI